MIYIKRFFLYIYFTFCFNIFLYSQPSILIENPIVSNISRAKELHQIKIYDLAKREFENASFVTKNENSVFKTLADAMQIYGDFFQLKEMTKLEMEKFINNQPISNHTTSMLLKLGYLLSYLGENQKAFENLLKINEKKLLKDEKRWYIYLMGYHYAIKKDIEKALIYYSKCDTLVKDELYFNTKYYFGLYLLETKQLDTAFFELNRLTIDQKYKNIVPYILVEILKQKNDTLKLLEYSNIFLNQNEVLFKEKILYSRSEIQYNMSKFNDIVNDFKKYGNNQTTNRIYQYRVGLSYTNIKDYENSIPIFQNAIDTLQDSLSQIGYYNLANSYLKLDNKKSGLLAFSKCAELNKIKDVQEVCAINEAKLAYEIKFYPLISPTAKILEFINKYPNSEYISECYEILSDSYLSSNNYLEALNEINKISFNKLSNKLKKMAQQLNFYLAVDLFLNNLFDSSLIYFNEVLRFNVDNDLVFISKYWMAEIYFRQNNLEKSEQILLELKNYNTLKYNEEFIKIDYNLAYLYLEKKETSKAAEYFKLMINNYKKGNINLYFADASVRLGDIYFNKVQYHEALSYYEKSLSFGEISNEEYIKYKIAQLYGLIGYLDKKINLLEKLIILKSNSISMANYLNELGETYLKVNNNKKALETYQRIIDDFNGSSYYVLALMQSGTINYNQKKNSNALSLFKSVVRESNDPSYTRFAIEKIKLIYSEEGNIEEYTKFVKSIPGLKITDYELDSATFKIAKFHYIENNVEIAKQTLEKYIVSFPSGSYILNAKYYLANLYSKSNIDTSAVKLYKDILDFGKTSYTEEVMIKLLDYYHKIKNIDSVIVYSKLIMVNTEKVENVDLARYFLIDASYQKNKCEDVITNYIDLSNSNLLTINQKIASKYYMGKCLFEVEEYDSASIFFNEISKSTKTLIGAEARFWEAKILFLKEEYDKSIEVAFTINEEFYNYELWVVSGFELIGDCYTKKEDYFQAKHTYKSILDNFKSNQEIIKRIKSKLASIKDKKNDNVKK